MDTVTCPNSLSVVPAAYEIQRNLWAWCDECGRMVAANNGRYLDHDGRFTVMSTDTVDDTETETETDKDSD